MITDINQLDLNKKYTYADYLTWQFDEMVELIKGKIFKISSAPNRMHQEVSGNIFTVIGNHLRRKTCKVYHAYFDVRLPLPPDQHAADKIDTVVQPDISVVCDTAKLDHKGCNGAPDWIIEILSDGTAKKDLNEKFSIYEHAGVKEYWIVHPHEHTLLIYYLNETGTYELTHQKPYTKGDVVNPKTFPDLEMSMDEVFE